ncbi:hypothetical protein [Taibaiella chishuiensis]|uniref:Uncharacterized protein n=1 Tax=Taibaiella chishuiensis TaxID=1434707 RepID=A0A2P8D1Y0_9BACT|nr:hypothetical protein [Taibaiella chishuiensis]PSK91222.1 hypothetical protein B0I18_106234 [Taibaiella chishuiensis]
MLSRSPFQRRLNLLYRSPQQLQQEVEDNAELPAELAAWLGRLRLLNGVPINYLVPDEGMLPPESIRFFYLDPNWAAALLDGAYSIGRNLTISGDTNSMALDRASAPMTNKHRDLAAAAMRPGLLGQEEPVIDFNTVSGFILRSSLVQNYPGMGVNPYPLGGTPDNPDPTKVVLLNILRMEQLGPNSDTLICLIEGDAYRIDIHEAPEALHYGLDSYKDENGQVTSSKTIFPFTKTGNPQHPSVTMDMQNPQFLNLDTYFRTSDPRTLNMSALAALIGSKQTPALASIDAAEMGFEMTEGVGMVSFYNKQN